MTTPRSPITSRFQVLESPILSPGKCCMCGAHNRPVVDTSLELNVEGYAYRVYICILCLLDASAQVNEYLENKGELESEASSIQKYLSQNNLKVIPDELYESLVFWSSGISGAIDNIVGNPHNVEEEPEGEPASDREDDGNSGDDDESVLGDDEREPKADSKPRSASLLSFDGDFESGFNL